MMQVQDIRIDGRLFSPKELFTYALEQSADSGLPGWKQEIFAFLAAFLDPELPELWQQTSGTTGDPQRLELSRGAMCYSATRSLRAFGLEPGDAVLNCLPVRYIAGKMMLVRALCGGLDLRLVEPSSRPLAEANTRPLAGGGEGFAFTAMVPLQVHTSLEHNDPLDRCRRLLVGGGELYGPDRERLAEMKEPEIWESFGMSETYAHIALRRINGPGAEAVFRTLEGVSIARDEDGCLLVRDPGLSAEDIPSRDLVEIREPGAFRWLGRLDNLINSGGVKLNPELLEERIGGVLKRQVLVLGEEDPRLGHRLVLLVEQEGALGSFAKAGSSDTAKAGLEEEWALLLEKELERYERPARIIQVEKLPRNTNLKVDRTRARDYLL